MSTQKFNMGQMSATDVNKAALSDKVQCNNGKDWPYISGYHLSRQQKHSVSQDDKSSTYIMPFNVSEVLEWVHCNTETFGMKLSWSYLKSW